MKKFKNGVKIKSYFDFDFVTEHKKGDILLCIKEVSNTIFTKGKNYKIYDVGWGWAGDRAYPHYILKGVGNYKYVFTSNESFRIEQRHGGTGVSGCGKINEYFVNLKKSRKEKLDRINGL